MKTLNIKKPAAHKLAQALADETGESLTDAVTIAIEERLERVRRVRKPESEAADLLTIGQRCAAYLRSPAVVDHGALLYDERGLPR